MKDDELSKIILDLEIDNVTQQRELFKHMALLSSAIISIFAFGSNQSINTLAKIGIGGLFAVIIISIILIFFALIKDKEKLKISRSLSSNVKEIKDRFAKIVISELLTKDNIKDLINFLKEDFSSNKSKNSKTMDRKIDDFIEKFSILINTGDIEIEASKENAKVAARESAKNEQIFNIVAIIGIGIFIISIGLILTDILM